ncbi:MULTISPECIES: hypothetical protein [unclassified Pseudomonas]|uniref:hypothetical protein n=1 Tax=unclassified Pseudomonas TaxID=196821 RepID=UPI000D3C9829|nr:MULTISPECIES: hypothetical protein [unclassified Pseudomonas]RAU48145.1 hypothetical protein DBP26_004970 [Pseudomonas sp. RIT 409]RAU55553.1 hypothetical protein DBY65_005695 [Pseudomonas sp. RIT 412]
MKITGKVQIEAVTDVVCDICLLTTTVNGGGFQFGTLQAHWGYGTKHDGERYEVHLCEGCFFQAIANLKEQRRGQIMFRNDVEIMEDDFGLVTRDDFVGDTVRG